MINIEKKNTAYQKRYVVFFSAFMYKKDLIYFSLCYIIIMYIYIYN